MKKILIIAFIGSFTPIFAQKTYNTGLEFDDATYANTPVKKAELTRSYESLPAKMDLKSYCPTPQLQADKSTCVGWAIGYAACTITEGVAKNIMDKTQLADIATSPDFVYAFGKKPTDKECARGIDMNETLTKLYGRTIPRKKDFQMVCTNTTLPTPNTNGIKIKQHTRLFKDDDAWALKLNQLKKTLANKKPIVIGIECAQSFFDLKDVWDGNTTNFRGGHALCIVGYDDAYKTGCVEVINSWGREWGKEGFGWIKYSDLQGILKYAFEIETDCSLTGQNPNSQAVPKSIELVAKINLTLADGQDMPLILNTENTANTVSTANTDKRGLKPVKESDTNTGNSVSNTTNTTPSVPTASNALLNAFAQYKTVQPYTSGTRYRVYLAISQPVYLYVLGSDLSGQIAPLFPPDATISPYLSNKNTTIALPDEHWFIEMDDTKGKDFMLFLYSPTPLPIATIVKELNAEKGVFLEKINKKLGPKLQFIAVKQTDKNTITSQEPLISDKIQALSLEIEHQ